MLNSLKTLTAAAALMLTAGAASAATVYATSVSGTLLGDQQATTCSVADRNTFRTDMCNALGEEDVDGAFELGGFVSLANFDALTFSFGTFFSAPVTVWEVTGGGTSNPGYVESLTITLMNSITNNSVIGSLVNVDGVGDGPNRWKVVYDASGDAVFDSITFVDTSDLTGKRDGFDIDAVAVSAVPLPAGALLLLGGLGGLAAMRRRKKA